MSTTARPISLTHAKRQRREGAPRALRTFALRWNISPAALLASPPAATLLNGQAARLKSCALVIRTDAQTARAELHLELITAERSVIPLGAPAPVARSFSASGIDHTDAPGLLSATLRHDDNGETLLYARTPLLERTLSLPGGVYEAPTLA